MKLFRLIPLLLMFAFFNSSGYAAQDCDEVKGNIVGKLFCKVKGNVGDKNTENSSSIKKINQKRKMKMKT